MLISLLSGRLDFMTAVVQILASLVVIFLIMPFHEWAHAFTAYKLGDTSVKYRVRLTLNPIEHIDPIGALLIILVGFGWAKPVPVDDRNFKNPKVGMGITALAEPLANFVAALAGGLILNALVKFTGFWASLDTGTVWYYIYAFLSYYIVLNICLAVFNLVPIPPLDGSRVLEAFLPYKYMEYYYWCERYGTIILLFLLLFGRIPF